MKEHTEIRQILANYMSDKKSIYKLGLIAHNFNPSMWEAYASSMSSRSVWSTE